MYSNGPLPNHLKEYAFITEDNEEFALPKNNAIEYLKWCSQQGYEVLGFDTWENENGKVKVIEKYTTEGDTAHCLREIEAIDSSLKYYFNIWVKK